MLNLSGVTKELLTGRRRGKGVDTTTSILKGVKKIVDYIEKMKGEVEA